MNFLFSRSQNCLALTALFVLAVASMLNVGCDSSAPTEIETAKVDESDFSEMDRWINDPNLEEEIKERVARMRKSGMAWKKERIDDFVKRAREIHQRVAPPRSDDSSEDEEIHMGIFKEGRPTKSKRPRLEVDYSKTPRNNREYNEVILKEVAEVNNHFAKLYAHVPKDKLQPILGYLERMSTAQYRFVSDEEESQLWFEFQGLDIPAEIKKDPWFRFQSTVVRELRGRPRTLFFRRVLDIVRVYQSFDYPSQAILWAHEAYMENRVRLPSSERKVPVSMSYFQKYADAIYYYLKEDLHSDGEQLRHAYGYIARFVVHSQKSTVVFDRSLVVMSEIKDLDPWLKEMILGHLGAMRAWGARGTGFAGSVSEKGWEQLAKHIASSNVHYKKALEINPLAPEPAVTLMENGLVGKEDPGKWFREAITIQPDFMPAYTARFRTLQPRWGGSLEETLQVGYEQVDADPKTYTPYMIVLAFKAVNNDTDLRDKASVDKILDPELLHACYQASIAMAENESVHGFRQVIGRDWFLNTALAFAQLKKDQQLMYETLKRLGPGNVCSKTFPGIGIEAITYDPFLMLTTLEGELGPNKEHFADFFRLDQMQYEALKESRPKVIALVEKVKANGTEGRELAFFQRPLKKLDEYWEPFFADKTVPVKFTPDLLDWHSSQRFAVEFESKDAIIMNFGGLKPTVITHHIAVPHPKSVEFELEWLGDRNSFVPRQATGILPMTVEHGYKFFVGFKAVSNSLSLRADGLRQGKELICEGDDFIKGQKLKCRVDMVENQMTIFVNDRFAHRIVRPDFKPFENLSFGDSEFNTGKSKVRLSNIRIKRFKDGPMPTSPEKTLPYFEDLCKKYPDSIYHLRCRALATQQNKKYDLANQRFQEIYDLGDRSDTTLFFLGDYKDRNGDHKEAMRYYKLAHEGAADFRFVGGKEFGCAAAEAGSRYFWQGMTDPDQEVAKSFPQPRRKTDGMTAKEALFADSSPVFPIYTTWKWANQRLEAAYLAQDGNFEQAIKIMDQCVDKCPALIEDDLIMQLEQYKNKQLYIRDPDQQLFYLKGVSYPYFQ